MKITVVIYIVSIVLCLSGCSDDVLPKEIVMKPGMSIEATNKYGTIRVSYVDTYKRKYDWDAESKIIKLTPREERFSYDGQIGEGILGLYDPADAWFFHFGPRLVVQEAQVKVSSVDEAQRFLRQSSDFMDWVYTDDGLVVGFSKTPSRGDQINVDVYQLLVNGEKPKELIGSRPQSLKINEPARQP